MSKKVEEDLPPLILLEDLGMMFPTEGSKRKTKFGVYKCGFCETNFKANTYDINRGYIKSCGCYQKRRVRESSKTHGLRNSRLYGIWLKLKYRVLNPKNKNYMDYGGRGVKVCDEWLDVQNFYDWAMSNGYEENKGLSIDRIDNNGNYEPSNCRWVTQIIQSRNQRIRTNNKSRYKGVCFKKDKNKYIAQIGINKKQIYLGSFSTAEEGAVVYNNYIITNDLEGFPLNKLPDSHIHLQLPTKPHHQTLK